MMSAGPQNETPMTRTSRSIPVIVLTPQRP
jgi:hypothetical protein